MYVFKGNVQPRMSWTSSVMKCEVSFDFFDFFFFELLDSSLCRLIGKYF